VDGAIFKLILTDHDFSHLLKAAANRLNKPADCISLRYKNSNGADLSLHSTEDLKFALAGQENARIFAFIKPLNLGNVVDLKGTGAFYHFGFQVCNNMIFLAGKMNDVDTALVLFQGTSFNISINERSFNRLKNILQIKLRISCDIVIKYRDEDEDWMVIACDQDVNDALQLDRPVLEVYERENISKSIAPKVNSAATRLRPSSIRNGGRRDPAQQTSPGAWTETAKNSSPLDTAELDAHLLLADNRRLQHRAYESSAVRIQRFDTSVAAGGNVRQGPRRIRWEGTVPVPSESGHSTAGICSKVGYLSAPSLPEEATSARSPESIIVASESVQPVIAPRTETANPPPDSVREPPSGPAPACPPSATSPLLQASPPLQGSPQELAAVTVETAPSLSGPMDLDIPMQPAPEWTVTPHSVTAFSAGSVGLAVSSYPGAFGGASTVFHGSYGYVEGGSGSSARLHEATSTAPPWQFSRHSPVYNTATTR
jgi:hypothetical protein